MGEYSGSFTEKEKSNMEVLFTDLKKSGIQKIAGIQKGYIEVFK